MDRTASSGKVVISSQVTVAVREELERRAHEADRTLSAELRVAIRKHVEPQPANGKSEPVSKR